MAYRVHLLNLADSSIVEGPTYDTYISLLNLKMIFEVLAHQSARLRACRS